MAPVLYERFLDDPEVYRACEQFWRQLTDTITAASGQSGQWYTWIPRTYANGTPFEDEVGNPIWDGRSDQLDRAYRIIQGRVYPGTCNIAAWINSDEEYTELPRHELVISLALTEDTASVAERLLREWIRPETSRETMAAFIAQCIPDRGPD